MYLLSRHYIIGNETLQNPEFPVERTLTTGEPTGKHDNRTLFVLVLASMARSGSSVFSRILSTRQDSVLFYEPLWLKQKTSCLETGDCVNNYIKTIFQCTFTVEFEYWLKGKPQFFNYFSEEARLGSWVGEELKSRIYFDLRGACQNSPVRIIKVIRSRLSWVEQLLDDPNFNLKIIHLTRDPRASIFSNRRIGFPSDPYKRCGALNADLEKFSELVARYPTKLTQVSFETLCQNPSLTVSKLHSFLYGDPTIPQLTMQFTNLMFGYNEQNPTGMRFQAWRNSISEELLSEIENEPLCRSAITKVGHVVFGSISNTRNTEIKLENEDYQPSV